MRLVTIQSSAFKSVFEVLKEILNDVNVTFTKEGMFITTLETNRNSLVELCLKAENFEEYECEHPIEAGINVTNLFKLLKTITNTDVLIVSINCEEFMNIEIHNETNKSTTKFCLKLMDINESKIQIPPLNVNTITPMKSSDFQRICRDMSNIGENMNITRIDNLFKLKCDGDFANQETIIEVDETSNEISGVYSLKYLNIFTKATNMCAIMHIMQEDQGKFLVLKYNVANLGELKFYLIAKINE